ncbi:MAG: fumarylacetoacetate hydrolase family protein [Chloroflexota bacterium]|nr:fumarylacetoacetate hydrolase family protein [Chloroflexota bacterium]MDE2883574.1 fumarylacetoacetate hydrolase family protein [Chloroflexota bacterium]
MALTADQIQELADLLFNAEQSSDPVPPLTDRFPDMTAVEAYQVQQEVIRKRIQGGRRVVGKKVGLTSLAMQQMLGVGEPDYGVVLDDMTIADGATFEAGRLLQPRVEPEIAFMLSKDLKGPGVTVEDVLAATEYVFPALEIVASRVKDWKIKLQDTIADNASAGGVVLGDAHSQVSAVDLVNEELVYEKNGEEIARATGAAVLDNPANAVAWCANKLSEYGDSLAAGEFVIPGALCAMTPVQPGDTVVARFSTIGSVSVTFS